MNGGEELNEFMLKKQNSSLSATLTNTRRELADTKMQVRADNEASSTLSFACGAPLTRLLACPSPRAHRSSSTQLPSSPPATTHSPSSTGSGRSLRSSLRCCSAGWTVGHCRRQRARRLAGSQRSRRP